MTNAEKYKTSTERTKAFFDYCERHCLCVDCNLHERRDIKCEFAWLEAEAEEEKTPQCPFCGGEVMVMCSDRGSFSGYCTKCTFRSLFFDKKSELIASINKINAVIEAQKLYAR